MISSFERLVWSLGVTLSMGAAFNVQASASGHVGAVEVKDSTLGGHGHAVEACMARVLQGSTLPMRATAMQLAPESRTLIGTPALGAGL
jgi:hypothetical protein